MCCIGMMTGERDSNERSTCYTCQKCRCRSIWCHTTVIHTSWYVTYYSWTCQTNQRKRNTGMSRSLIIEVVSVQCHHDTVLLWVLIIHTCIYMYLCSDVYYNINFWELVNYNGKSNISWLYCRHGWLRQRQITQQHVKPALDHSVSERRISGMKRTDLSRREKWEL